MGDLALMQIAGDQAALITILVRTIGARRAIEVGTFLGYGAIAIARGLPDDGELVCCELEREYADRARAHLEAAGLADRVEFRLGPAAESLAALDRDGEFDFAFVDADKVQYPEYFEQCLRLVRPGGLIMLDNVFMAGRVLEEPPPDEGTRVISALNDRIAADDRVEVAMLAVADGVSLVRKR
jgi:caffeoyl-CoA O-methyltransferase